MDERYSSISQGGMLDEDGVKSVTGEEEFFIRYRHLSYIKAL